MKIKWVLLFVLLVLLIGCSSPDEPDYQATIDLLSRSQEESAEEEVVVEATNTTIPTDIPAPTDTAEPTSTNTIEPTPTNTAEPTQDTSLAKAKNFVASAEQNGVLIEVERILICDIYWDDIYKDFAKESMLDGKTTYIEFVFRVTNNTDKIIEFNFSRSIASANGEQISFYDYVYGDYFWGWGGDDLEEDILPGSMVSGFVWTGVKRSTWNEIEKIIISIPGAFDQDYDDVTNDFLIEIEVGDWGFEPMLDN